MDRIAVIGLGYVGLPLAVAFSKKYDTIGFDINSERVREISQGNDKTLEISSGKLKKSLNGGMFSVTSNLEKMRDCNIFIVTVPTPINDNKTPNLLPLINASKSIGKNLKKNDIVIYESTVFPGCTEEICIPELEKSSGLKFNFDFFCGYSPERINPGDRVNTIEKIQKITSGSTPETATKIDILYNSIIEAGTYLASSIKVAEAAKIIENTQRDINISFMNELALIFEKIGIDTTEVIEAAATKWNFMKYKPGLVGGHCISVDPYYLAFKAEKLGYHPAVILSGRRINEHMGVFIANKVLKLMIRNNVSIKNSNILILGITFKENCPDMRNSRVIDMYNEFKSFGVNIDMYDPLANKEEVLKEFNIQLIEAPKKNYEAVILAVSHKEFKELDYEKIKSKEGVLYDVRSFLDKEMVDARL